MERVDLPSAVESGNLELVKNECEDLEFDINSPYNDDKDTLLMLACKNGHIDIVKFFIENKNADPTIENIDGYTALSFAQNNAKIAEYLKNFSRK